MKTPIEQRAKPVKKRGLKKADLEEDFFFMRRFFCRDGGLSESPF